MLTVAAACTLVATAIAPRFDPPWITLYDAQGVQVKYREYERELEIHVSAPAFIYTALMFDYYQDGRLLTREKVDPVYSVQDTGELCAQRQIFGVRTPCSDTDSSAHVRLFSRNQTKWEYSLYLPKMELSAKGKSASVVLQFWNDHEQMRYFSPKPIKARPRFPSPILISFH